MHILGVGIATLDIVNRVAVYPAEDAEVRALGQRRARGGNATNTLVVLADLGHRAAWAGNLAEEPDSLPILADLEAHGVDLRYLRRLPHGKVPTSYVTLSEATGSRTIVHYRDLPEYAASDFEGIDLAGLDWIHFEGREPPALGAMMRRARAQGDARISLEVEKPRAGIEALFPLADLLLFSRHYVRARGGDDPVAFLEGLGPGVEAYCAWGAAGAWARSADGMLYHGPPVPPAVLVDTLGAGDVFNAGVIHARGLGLHPAEAVAGAARLAGEKCGREGLCGLRW